MSNLRLTYWQKRGRGEQVRLLLHELGLTYQDNYIQKGQPFRDLQAEGPSKLMFGSVPMLEDGDFKLVQAPVILSYLARKHGLLPDDVALCAKADAIAWGAEDLRIGYFGLFGPDAKAKQKAFVEGGLQSRWLPALEGLLEINESNEYFVGKSITHADVAVWDVLDSLLEWVEGVDFKEHPRVQNFFDAFKARPKIAAFLASDRRMKS